jgi:hypothetical protein
MALFLAAGFIERELVEKRQIDNLLLILRRMKRPAIVSQWLDSGVYICALEYTEAGTTPN